MRLKRRVERIERAADAFRWTLEQSGQDTESLVREGQPGALAMVNAMRAFAEMMR